QAEDGIRHFHVTGVQTCALPISHLHRIYVVGTADTKAEELHFLLSAIRAAGRDAILVDVGTTPHPAIDGIGADAVARHVPEGQEIGRASCREREKMWVVVA